MMSRLSVCKKFDRHRSAETCRALASPDRGLGCRQDSIGHVGQRGAVEVGTHPQAFFSSLFLETVPSSSTRSAAQQGPGRCGALFPLSFLPLHHNQPHQCQAAVKSCPLFRSERVMSVPGPGRLGLIGAAVSRRPQFLTIPSLLSTPILLSISRHHQRHHPPQPAPAACPSALPVRPPAPSSLLFRAFVQTSAPPPRPSPQLLPARPLPLPPSPTHQGTFLVPIGQPSCMSRFVADNMGSETMTTLAMKVLGLAKNAGRWFPPRLGPFPAQSSPAPTRSTAASTSSMMCLRTSPTGGCAGAGSGSSAPSPSSRPPTTTWTRMTTTMTGCLSKTPSAPCSPPAPPRPRRPPPPSSRAPSPPRPRRHRSLRRPQRQEEQEEQEEEG